MRRFGTAAILAGGKSRRMGFDKQMIRWEGEWLIRRLYGQLEALFDRVIVISNAPGESLEPHWEVFSDRLVDGGPLGGIHRALLESDTHYVFLMPCDMLRVDPDLVRLMRSRLEENGKDGSIARYGEWIEPFHGFYSAPMAPVAETLVSKGDYRIAHLLERFDVDYLPEALVRTYTPDWSLFRNLNAATDLTGGEKE